jgi:sugar lactone lactonase YvrE
MAHTIVHTARPISNGHTFLEGPRWHDGDLYVSDFFTERVLRFPRGTGAPEVVVRVAGRPSGLGFVNGDLLIASMLERRIMRWDGGSLTEYADLSALVSAPINDMLVDDSGRCYVGNFGHSADGEHDFAGTPLVLVQPDGSAGRAAEGLNFPNGIVRTGAGTLLVAETYAARVSEFSIGENGRLTPEGRWVDFGDIDYFDIDRAHEESAIEPDGLVVDANDDLWIADAKGSGIGHYRRGETEPFERVETGGPSVYAAALGGPDGATLFMCCAPRNRSADLSRLRSSVLMAAEVSAPVFRA